MNSFIYPVQRLLGAMLAMLVAFGSAQADSPKPEQRRFAQNAATAPGQTLYLEARHAEIVVSGSDENEIALEATGKPVELHIPADADIEARLQTKRGKIRSDFPLLTQEEGRNRRTARLELGNAGTQVHVRTDGDIRIEKQ